MEKNGSRVFFYVILFFLGYSSLYFIRSSISVSADTLQKIGTLSIVQYGLIGSLFFVIYAVGRLVNGFVGDYLEPRVLICTGILLSGLCCLLIGLYPVTAVVFIAWSVNAFAQSMVWSPMLVYVLSFKSRHNNFIISLMGAAVSFGTVIGTIFVPLLLLRRGIRGAFLVPGVVAISLAVVTWVFCGKREIRNKNEKEKMRFSSLLKTREFQYLIIPFVVNGVLKDGIPLWMVVYIMQVFDVDLSKISGYVVFIPLVGGVSRLLFEPFRKLHGSEIKVAIVASCLAFVFSIALILEKKYVLVSVTALALMYAFASVSNMSFVGIFPLRFSKMKRTSYASGLVDLLIYSGSGISSVVFGLVIKRFGFATMFGIWAILILASIFFLAFFSKKIDGVQTKMVTGIPLE